MADLTTAQLYLRTRKGLGVQMYCIQKGSAKKRKHPMPAYTAEEFRVWLFSQPNFEQLYKDWLASNCNKWLKPSADRLKDNLPYTLCNIQLITWQENSDKWSHQLKSGEVVGLNHAVKQYTKTGVFVQKYHSYIEAERQTGVWNAHISRVCRGKRKTAGGFIWKKIIN